MKSDDAVLLDVAKAAQQAAHFSQEVETLREFKQNGLVRSAVLHQVLVLGEAVKRLSDAFRVEHEHIPWGEVAGMRDRVIHGYDTVDLEIVWEVVNNDIPELLRQLEPLLPKRDE